MEKHIVGRSASEHYGRRTASLLFFVAVLLVLVAPACSSTSSSGLAATDACHLNSDCAQGLICALGACRAMCATAADCGSGGTCIDDGDVAVCQYASEANTPCNQQSDCPAPLACASDYRCRNLCTTAMDCNVLGITGRVCATDANGVHYCADPSEVNSSNMLDDAPPPGAPDTGVIEPVIDATTGTPDSSTNASDGSGSSSGGGSGSSSGSSSGGSGGGDATTSSGSGSSSGGSGGGDATTSSGSGSSSGGSSSGGGSSSSSGGVACSCDAGYECLDGGCVPCGGNDEPCCSGQCNANLTCSGGTCGCGGAGEACCENTSCNFGISCVAVDAGSSVCACGAAGEVCCPGDDGGSSTCSGSLLCAGTKCSCIAGAAYDLVRRSDGTLWIYGDTNYAATVIAAASGDLTVTAFADGGDFGCGVQSGNVWCFDYPGNETTDNTDGKLGNGTSTGSTEPAEVVTSVGGPPLGSITNVFSDSGGTNIACAINASGSLWCWGNGSNEVLGNGYTYNSTFAIPVLSQSGGSQFTGVAQLAVSADHACALKTNGTLWCWGNNTDGQLGLGTTQSQVPYPTQVTFPGDAMGVVNVVVTAGSSNTGPVSCAVTGDGRVWCWGSNESGALANGLTTGTATSPTQILTSGSDAGPAFGGAVEVQFYNSNTYGDSSPWVCVVVRKSADGSLWVWGNDTSSLFPQPYLEGEDVPVSGALSLAPTTEYSPEFIASDGTLHLLGGPAPVPLSCP